MAFTLADVETAARDLHGAFHQTRVPGGPVARFLTDYQNQLIGKLTAANPYALAQTATIALSLSRDDAPGTAGAGTTGGVPGTVDAEGSIAAVQATSGTAIEVAATTADGATVVVAERLVTSATSTTLTSTGAARTTDADIGRVLRITAGTGQGQVREIVSNTAETWTVASTFPFDPVPDTTSLVAVLAPTYVGDRTAGVVTALPAVTATRSYLVKLDATGQPYLDYTAPLVATVETGVSLPALHALLGGTVYDTDGCRYPLTITSPAHRAQPVGAYTVYPVGEAVRFVGTAEDWQGIASLELHYAPVAPAFTARTDYFLLPDAARPAVVAQLAAFMALRVAGTEGIAIDPAAFAAKAEAAEANYLRTTRLTQRATRVRMRGMDDAW